MANRNSVLRTVTVTEPQIISLQENERKCETLIIKTAIIERPLAIGVIDKEKLIPRYWTGYWYLLNKNSIEEVGAIDFENETILRRTQGWKGEIPLQIATQLINIPNAEPGTVAEQTAVFNLLTQQDGQGAYYLPLPQPYDAIALWFPPGAIIGLSIEAFPWSDILNPDGSVAIPVEENVEELLETPSSALENINEPPDLVPYCESLISQETEDPACRSVYLIAITYTVTDRLIIDRSPGFPGTANKFIAYEVGSTFTLTRENSPNNIRAVKTGTATSYPSLSDAENNTNGTVDTNNTAQWGCGYFVRGGDATIN